MILDNLGVSSRLSHFPHLWPAYGWQFLVSDFWFLVNPCRPVAGDSNPKTRDQGYNNIPLTSVVD